MEQAAVQYRLSAIYVTFEHEANNTSLHAGLGSGHAPDMQGQVTGG